MPARGKTRPSPAQPKQSGSNEEPDITQEESVPLDGKDEVGEKMIQDLGRELDQRSPRK